MKGYVANIEDITLANENFRTVLYTAKYSQLVVMSIPLNGDIGEEVHGLDQFLRIEAGEGTVILDGVEHALAAGSAIVVPAGTRHNVINTSDEAPLKLYSVYSPPNHRDGVVHKTKSDAEADEEHFDGKTTE
jgi:mannose-6-phosphate isomerase-like protein (cupin superfamily)